MAHSTSLNLHQLHSVAPPHATTATTFPLTFFDILWLRLPPVERLFFYEFPTTSKTTSFYDIIVPNLKHSLSLTLQHFIPLVGNITWPLESSNPIINYVPGDAVSFTVAESNSDNFNHLCSNLCDVVDRQHLIPRLNISHEQASVLSLQVTLFPNSGFCIGITTHHAAVDGKSSTMFLKTWAYFCSKIQEQLTQIPSSLPENQTPFLDRSVINDPSGITEAFVDSWLNYDGPNNRSLKVWDTISAVKTEQVKGLFELTPSHIQKLKKHALSKVKTKVSTFSVTCAYLLSCLAKVEKPKDERVAFIFSVDCRTRLDSPILATYFGNCVFPQLVVVETNKLVENDGFIIALEGIIDALNKLEDGVLNEGEKWMSKIQSAIGNRLFSTAGSPRFEVYGIDFGWGRPKKVDVTSIDKTGAFSLSESKNNDGGVEVGLALNKVEMEAFLALFHQQLESF
ncbi:hypothetical protein TanjilG_29958 [Lupinus angustifolius]|uniref:Uncharacterized protein n=1 Tax=Lupinus angustifolius TaxID=3871 RepID=A0A1J7HVV1_LUPAN|nr:PREDICTED: phenolic glucoside malonyltransferase 1-like [Lupinus angustifolius]XP_019452976.1 PREDICTED: phenolic glucoside malonyltransferase 1-like [Lupinus angustifolius]OIW06537.1 hypothetical protein TanjilG_29958 [Lupinus angustifolius]